MHSRRFCKMLAQIWEETFFSDCTGDEDSPDTNFEDEEFENEDDCYDTMVTEENEIRAE